VLNIGSGAGLSNASIQLRLTIVRLFDDRLIERGLCKGNPAGRRRYAPGKAFSGKRERGFSVGFNPIRCALACASRVAVPSWIGRTLEFVAVLHLYQVHYPSEVQNAPSWRFTFYV
jgi:hypothetical protein